MYSQVPIPIHGDTIECVVKIKFVFVILLDDFWKKNYFMDNNAQATELNWYCITYLTNSDTIKNAGIGPIPIPIPGIGAALISSYTKYVIYSYVILCIGGKILMDMHGKYNRKYLPQINICRNYSHSSGYSRDPSDILVDNYITV